jgi:hypothetical protein
MRYLVRTTYLALQGEVVDSNSLGLTVPFAYAGGLWLVTVIALTVAIRQY